MLRGFATINYWADDVEAAKRWYADLLGIEPYLEDAELGVGEPTVRSEARRLRGRTRAGRPRLGARRRCDRAGRRRHVLVCR
jgi:hypothetical protein